MTIFLCCSDLAVDADMSLLLYKVVCIECTLTLKERDISVKADFQSVLRTRESLFTFFVLFHVRRHEM